MGSTHNRPSSLTFITKLPTRMLSAAASRLGGALRARAARPQLKGGDGHGPLGPNGNDHGSHHAHPTFNFPVSKGWAGALMLFVVGGGFAVPIGACAFAQSKR